MATLGQHELDLLSYIAEHTDITVGEVAEEYGHPKKLARSTVVTMMERLRRKGYLIRHNTDGVYRYASTSSRSDMLRKIVSDFVDRTLGGSVSPFAAYLAEAEEVSDEDLAVLADTLKRLESRGKRS